MSLLYAEDLPEGTAFELASHRVSAEEIKEFATDWDPLPFHVDEVAAAEGPFGGLVASGAHTLAVCVRLISDAFVSRTAIVAGRGIVEARFVRPVRPDTLLSGRMRITDRKLSEPRSGTIVLRGELYDENERLVLVLVGEMIIRRRVMEPSAGSAR